MTVTTASKLQVVEDALTAASAQLDRAVSALAGLELDDRHPDQGRALAQVLKARRRLEKATDAIADRLFDASAALAPEAVDLDF